MKKLLALIICLVLCMSGCSGSRKAAEEPTEDVIYDAFAEHVDEIMSEMTLYEKICQLLFVTPETLTGVQSVTVAGEATRAALEKYPVGGIIYFAANLKSREQIEGMIANSQAYARLPLFIGVDEEGGRVARLGNQPRLGTVKLPAMASVKSIDEAYKIGKTLGEDVKGFGFNVDFAPVADVIVNEKNNEIGDRSFGSDPYWVSDMVQSVVQGIEQNGVSSVLKHFPGHGSTVVDSHTGYSDSPRTLRELKECEFLPFKAGIEAGCGIVMVSHMTLTNAIEEKVPASLSGEVIQGFLRGELGFDGIVITDSLSMGAITREYESGDAAVTALLAGADMLLMPPDIRRAVEAVEEAVGTGTLTEARIDESVRRIISHKIVKGLII